MSTAPEDADELTVEVAFAQPQRAIVKRYRVPRSATIDGVLQVAARDPDFAGIDLLAGAVGIFGRLASATQAVRDGDRIEIYRPLAADPKSARRARARAAPRGGQAPSRFCRS